MKTLLWLVLAPIIIIVALVSIVYISITMMSLFSTLSEELKQPEAIYIYLSFFTAIFLFCLWIAYGNETAGNRREKFANLFREGRLLRLLAIFIWCVSLLLPGIIAQNTIYNGMEILAFMPLAFINLGGTAAYANIFFWILVFCTKEKPIRLLTTMWLLTLSMLLFNSITTLSGGGQSSIPVYSWGWGAVLWLVAQILLTSIFCTHEGNRVRAQYIGLLLSALLIGSVAAVGAKQRAAANSDELARFFPNAGAAITVRSLSGIPYHPYPEEFRIPQTAGLMFINQAGTDEWAEKSYLSPSYSDFTASPEEAVSGYYYKKYDIRWRKFYFYIGYQRAQADYIYHLSHLSSNNTLTTTLTGQNGKIIWQQPQIPRKNKYSREYFIFYPGLPSRFLWRDYSEISQDYPIEWQTHCSIEGGRNFRWQHTHIIAPENYTFLSHALCRSDYTLLFARDLENSFYTVIADTQSGAIIDIYSYHHKEEKTISTNALPQRATLKKEHDELLTLYDEKGNSFMLDDANWEVQETYNRHNIGSQTRAP